MKYRRYSTTDKQSNRLSFKHGFSYVEVLVSLALISTFFVNAFYVQRESVQTRKNLDHFQRLKSFSSFQNYLNFLPKEIHALNDAEIEQKDARYGCLLASQRQFLSCITQQKQSQHRSDIVDN